MPRNEPPVSILSRRERLLPPGRSAIVASFSFLATRTTFAELFLLVEHDHPPTSSRAADHLLQQPPLYHCRREARGDFTLATHVTRDARHQDNTFDDNLAEENEHSRIS